MKKKLCIVIILLLTITAAFSQELRLVVSDKPLNTVLNTLDVEISFDDKALSNYKVSVSKTFNTPEEAIRFLLKDKPFKVEKVGSVYVISPAPPEEKIVIRKTYTISGELTDKSTGELLPYAYIRTNKGIISTNEAGYFSIVKETKDPMQIHAQYMGFETLDTLLNVGNHKLYLNPATISLDEVVIAPSSSTMLMQSGRTSGEMRINHQIARYMPGSADNSVFNLLRMMPGVRASGEPSEDLIVWGSNWGESRLVYDGFTIFGMKSFNDQIGSVNPYLAKDLRLLKGGYDVSQGNRIGAVTEITGNEGNFKKPSIKANVSNYTANIYASVPIKQSSALSVAYRQTFYNLYNNESIVDNSNENDHGNGNNNQASPDIYIEPEYDFRDLNLKYAGRASENDNYYISLYGADDHFKFSVKQQEYKVAATEKNKQYGAAANYNRVWNNSNNSKFLFSYSRFSAAIDNVSGITETQSTPLDVFQIKNTVQEFSLKLEHNFDIGRWNKVQIGGEWQHYTTSFNNTETSINNPSLHITDNISLGKLSLNAGLRADLIPDDKIYLQPRLSARYAFSDELTATASFGLYSQFLTRVPYQYRSGSYQMIWNLTDSTSLSSTQFLAGLAYSKNGWLVNGEGYVKKNRNQLYYIDNTIYALNNTNVGVDIFAKKEWRGQTAFASYSLVNSSNPQEESTGQEIKVGAICSLKSFCLSATYVYGTGFPYLSTGGHGHGQGNEEGQHGNSHKHSDVSSEPYSRLDLSLIYKMKLKKFRLQTGASVLNAFDTNNVKYSYRLSDQNNVFNIYTKATPFTPVVFFEIIF
ncbi:MAG: TonB-dependent receptor [Tannerella sp.]|nr:TonB-dependent receptor [Tannerella sp.]